MWRGVIGVLYLSCDIFTIGTCRWEITNVKNQKTNKNQITIINLKNKLKLLLLTLEIMLNLYFEI